MSNDRSEHDPAGKTRAFSKEELDELIRDSSDDFDFAFAGDVQSKVPRERRNPILGEYVILDRLGSGGMGQVYRAKHRTMDREVAVKILPKRLSSDPIAVERFYAEVRAQGRLMHPNIVTAFDAGCHRTRTNTVHYLVMELIHGESLSQRVSLQGPMSAANALQVLKQAATALEYAHGLGIVHRDIKPCDMWSIGVIAYILFAGYPPFNGTSNKEVYNAVRNGTYYFPSEDWQHISIGARNFVMGLLQRDPMRRMTVEQALRHPWLERQMSSMNMEESRDSVEVIYDRSSRKDSILFRGLFRPRVKII